MSDPAPQGDALDAASASPSPQRDVYRSAGVDVAAGERAVTLLRDRLGTQSAVDLLGGLGGFGSAVELPEGLRRPVVLSATDGVGTKTEIARALGRLETIGQDLVAMCADDLACHGAQPWLFLDYLAVGRVDPEAVATIVGGIVDGCRLAGCSLVGGETAEHPGIMEPDQFDLAGFCLGLVERDRLIDGSTSRPGDPVIGLAASGFHANGYSLIRAIVARHALDLEEPYAALVRRLAPGLAVESELASRSLGELLLTPTRIYAPALLALRDLLDREGLRLSGIAHVTGGGLPGNLPRAVPDALGIEVQPARWPMSSLFRLFGGLAGLSDVELRATWNAGIGMALVVEPRAETLVVAELAERGIEAWPIGQVVEIESGSDRYVERGG